MRFYFVDTSFTIPEPHVLDRCRRGMQFVPDRLAARAAAEGLLAPGENLLPPHFYLAAGLEPWIHERVASFSQAAP